MTDRQKSNYSFDKAELHVTNMISKKLILVIPVNYFKSLNADFTIFKS